MLIFLGLALFRDYGVSWDEQVEHYYGVVSIKYIAKHLHPAAVQTGHEAPDLATFPDRDHGPAFEITVPIISRLLTSDSPRAYLLTRHLLIFSLSVLGTWALYRLGRAQFQDWRLGLLGATALVISPRFFAESFYNGKDIVFLALFTAAIYVLTLLLLRPTVTRALLLGLLTGLAIDVRILGLILVALTLGMLVLEAVFRPRTEVQRRRWLSIGVLYLAMAAMCTVSGWPYLWAAPLSNFLDAFQRLSRYPWLMSNFYLGEFVPSDQLPWHYSLVWILITTPVPYTAACLVGLVAWTRTLLRAGIAGLATRQNRLDLLFAGWLLGPILLVIVLKSVLYDGWRHLYFVYPALLLFGLRGVQALYRASRRQRTWRRVIVAAAVLATLEVGHTVVRMILMHPYQQVYFSFLPARVAEQYFERDYWGLAYRQGLEWILTQEAAPHISVSAPNPELIDNNTLMMSPEQRQRILHMPRQDDQYQYFMTNYRWHPQTYRDSVGQEVYSITADGIKILSVFKRR
ncbi:glycosyltransferase family 39 protein [Hymenobacter sp. GOD-10R]|uniref:glycosyltransferase family 39 protein n=1 Tax=Hymenobacter sp. GOD-10R TaxID=3093922 RepID=UPI002D76AAEC|nr:glycosyltransferase family 39 protein [Hymenobacter sp. GOD-10R]WRQ28458.1 glycosyltransferase family 39 protein [Hymenobacter sp. GOD-10R]